MQSFNAIIFSLAANSVVIANAQTIESYVAPQDLFPSESSYQAHVPAPLDAFDGPNGNKIGVIRIAKPHCLTTPKKNDTGCEFPMPIVYQAIGKSKTSNVEIMEWTYETMGMPSYKPSIQKDGNTWSLVKHENGTVWVKTKKDDVHAYEDITYLVNNIKELCLEPGNQCTVVGPSVTKEMNRVALITGTCYDSPYTVVDRVVKNGKRYYKLNLENLESEDKTSLPSPIYVPTRNPDGTHTGYFFSRGC